ncbi:MAG TPA: diversity-generating retroelement protein bAvd family protein [Clostridiales bacterium]|nr:diversity-generating retroelement protein bAvd family protein [Clostridiales bacterium]
MDNLLNRIYPALKNFPKSEKFALAQDIKTCFTQYLNYIDRANSVKSKRLEYSQEAQGYLNTIKILIRTSYRQHYVGNGFYKDISMELTEVSKMLVGYIKAINRK